MRSTPGFLLIIALVSGCAARRPPSLDQHLQSTEAMHLGCMSLLREDPNQSIDCEVVYRHFRDARDCYAKVVDSRALTVKMGDVTWFRPIAVQHPDFGDVLYTAYGNLVYAYFYAGPAPVIHFANIVSIWHETMHFLHYTLHGEKLRQFDGSGDGPAATYEYEIIAHRTPDDPILNAPCERPEGS